MSDRLDQLLKLQQADPEEPFLTYGIALEHAKQGDSAEAIVWLDRTLQTDPAYCYAYFQKAKMFEELGDTSQARAAAQAGIQAAEKARDDHARSELGELLAMLDEDANP